MTDTAIAPANFALIIGAMKAGSTSLFDYLATHPQLLGSRKKEQDFFAVDAKYARGPDYYHRLWKGFDPAVHRYALEASPNYTKYPRYPMTAERIARFSSRFRLIYILRDPVDRIESHLAHNIAKGRLTPDAWQAGLAPALATSRYAVQLDRFRTVVAEPEVLLLDFAELRDDPRALLNRCTRFLEIDDFAFVPRPASNPGKALPGGGRFRLDIATRRRLRHELAPDMARLTQVHGFDTTAWQTEPAGGADPVADHPDAALAEPVFTAAAATAPDPDAGPERAPAVGPRRRRHRRAAGRAAPGPRRGYWNKRRDMMYYKYVLTLAKRLARPARSLIDVGSHNTSLAEELDWIPERVALDINRPYTSAAVRGVKADFLAYEPEQRFDFALCLQVLEHIPDAAAFAAKLQQVAPRLLVSVPYRWPEGACAHHCQDPVDAEKLAGWFGRAPDYQVVVEEPLRRGAASRRLVAYFHTPGEEFRPRDFPKRRRA